MLTCGFCVPLRILLVVLKKTEAVSLKDKNHIFLSYLLTIDLNPSSRQQVTDTEENKSEAVIPNTNQV